MVPSKRRYLIPPRWVDWRNHVETTSEQSKPLGTIYAIVRLLYGPRGYIWMELFLWLK